MSEQQMMADQAISTFPFTVSVRFKNSGKAISYGTEDREIKAQSWVVVETAQGIEMGQCVSDAKPIDFFHKHVPLKPVIRIADENDQKMYEENQELSKEAFDICNAQIEELQLGMHLISAEYLLDRSRVLFVYQAAQRVDFRELLKQLGSRLHTRVELRQIGDRDKAKMIGAIGVCGMETCCSRFKTHMDVISINMAKTQGLALNTEKLSGVCGKLMCCLKYENDTYEELTDGLPKNGAHVEYEGEMFRVASINVMSGEARLENSERYLVITTDELREKAEVRKGVTIGRKGCCRNRQQQNTAPGVHKPTSTNAPISTNFKTSEESKKHTTSQPSQKDQERRKNPNPDSVFKSRKPLAGASQEASHAKKDRSERKGGGRKDAHAGLQPQKPQAHPHHASSGFGASKSTNNPNVTVRSFKSRKKEGE